MQRIYKQLFDNGELQKRTEYLLSLLQECTLCPRRCGVNRLTDHRGFCKTGRHAIVSSYCVHRGEEPPISGQRGSGTIFFACCNLRCIFCQNYDISHGGEGDETSAEDLAHVMIDLEKKGCHNINFVSPSHVVPQIFEALCIAIPKGLSIPLVYNTNGYDTLDVLQQFDGIIDIYLPDFKYSSDNNAQVFSSCSNYWQVARSAIKEMYRQVGPLQCGTDGVAEKGVLVRHLVLPNNVAGSYEILEFLAKEISHDIALGIMAQYNPCFKAYDNEQIARKVTVEEYGQVLQWCEEFEFSDVFSQKLSSSDIFLPNFKKADPFNQKL